MTSEIYYFSGTGNSLALAKDIAHKIDGKLIPIPSVINDNKISPEADVIGIVFPSYYETLGGVPLIVRRFIKKLENMESKYIFAICTYGGASVTAMNCLEKIIHKRGGKIMAEFTVNMPSNMAGPNLNNTKKQEKLFDVWNKNLDYISEFIKTRKEGRFDAENVLFGRAYRLIKLIYSPLMFLFKPSTINHLKKYSNASLPYEQQLPLMDKSFSTNTKCNGCGTCSKICPVNNIEIIEDKPSWHHHCEFCLACFHWCPKEAIISSELENPIRYHHPNIKISDMMRVD